MRDGDSTSGSGVSGPLPYAAPGARYAPIGRPVGDEWERGSGASTRTRDGNGNEPAIGPALARAYDASKAIVSERLALMRLDTGRYASRLVIGAALLVVGVVLVVGSWFGLIVGFVLWMGVQWGAMLSLPVRLVIAAGVTLVAATVAMAIGVGTARKPAAHREQRPRPAAPERAAH
jgi:hypothetical protein